MTTNLFTTAKGASVRFFTDSEEITSETVISCEIVGVMTFTVSRFEQAHPMDKVWGFTNEHPSIEVTVKGNIEVVKKWINEKKAACRARDFAFSESLKNAACGKGDRAENMIHGKNNW